VRQRPRSIWRLREPSMRVSSWTFNLTCNFSILHYPSTICSWKLKHGDDTPDGRVGASRSGTQKTTEGAVANLEAPHLSGRSSSGLSSIFDARAGRVAVHRAAKRKKTVRERQSTAFRKSSRPAATARPFVQRSFKPGRLSAGFAARRKNKRGEKVVRKEITGKS